MSTNAISYIPSVHNAIEEPQIYYQDYNILLLIVIINLIINGGSRNMRHVFLMVHEIII